MTGGVAWVDGRLVPPDEPAIRADDRGLLVGDGVFETMKVVGGTPFALTRHLARLDRSASVVGLPPTDGDLIRRGLAEALAADPGAGRVRVTCTAASEQPGTEAAGGTVVVLTGPARPSSVALRLVTVPWPRNERGALVGAKSTSYSESAVALRHAQSSGADEALLANTRHEVCEGTATNVFVAIDGRLLTPPLSSGCLAGVTRELLLEVLDGVVEEAIPFGDLARATELFVTSSIRDVVAVSHLDGRPLSAAPGPHTRRALHAWAAAYGAPGSPLDP